MAPEYMELTRYSPLVMGWRWVWFHLCELIAIFAVGKNFLPHEVRFADRPRLLKMYKFVVHLAAFLGGGWRICSPSLDMEFMGFRHPPKAVTRSSR